MKEGLPTKDAKKDEKGKGKEMHMPKPRRKNYKYFANFDVVKYEGEWFIRFPSERDYVHFGEAKTKRLMGAVMKEISRSRKEFVSIDGIPIYTPVRDLRPFVTDLARSLLAQR